ncbi:DNA repair protein RecO C-terminal domain-containing protein [Paracoccus sp. (in: a-proteobacteria)]|uniref:DNA repair protein RecO C-terminal domain-containing protein n=1 Tax=Paracoccus sp. TaxID=267 RepID=UPI00272B0987|nr:DNA repair protein RecO C-terminal domain-containing protein [Paracoccus sp. (in: a-proteobacteria)]
MAQVTTLAMWEQVRVDTRRVAGIVNELGETSARNVIELALEQLAAKLTAVDQALSQGDLAQAAADAERVARLAWQIGLLSLAGVAMDLGSCADRGDRVALAAVQARLMRVGNRSLTAIWDRTALA